MLFDVKKNNQGCELFGPTSVTSLPLHPSFLLPRTQTVSVQVKTSRNVWTQKANVLTRATVSALSTKILTNVFHILQISFKVRFTSLTVQWLSLAKCVTRVRLLYYLITYYSVVTYIHWFNKKLFGTRRQT